jgi:hypothetical protein
MRGIVMTNVARNRLMFVATALLVLLTAPVRGQQEAAPRPAWPPAVDGPQPLPPAIQPTIHTTTCPVSPPLSPDGTPWIGSDGAKPTQASRFAQFGPSAEVGLLDNFMLFAGLDGSKAPEDLGINANMGSRVGFNWGIPLWQDVGLGFQVGVAENFHNNAVRVLKPLDGTSQRFQTWVTLGLFQRSDIGVNWGAVYDFRFDDYYQSLTTGQVRMQVGYNVTTSDEFGLWGSIRTREDDVRFGGFDLDVRPMNQGAMFWRHIWGNNAVTRVWAGMADSHGRFVLTSPGASPTNTPFLFGADIFIPLNDCVAIWGEANVVTPNDTGTVTAFMGVAFTPGTANLFGRSRFAPYLPTANNNSFSLDVR